MAMIVSVQDDQDPYARTGRAVQNENGSWSVDYFKPGGLDSTGPEHGDLIGSQTVPADQYAHAGDVAEFMCQALADRTDAFGGIFPDAGYQHLQRAYNMRELHRLDERDAEEVARREEQDALQAWRAGQGTTG